MANNVFAGRLNSVHCKLGATMDEVGINPSNTNRVYWLGDETTSYDPLRDINVFDEFVQGEDYLIHPKIAMDLTTWFYPPYPSGEGTGIIAEDGTIIEPE